MNPYRDKYLKALALANNISERTAGRRIVAGIRLDAPASLRGGTHEKMLRERSECAAIAAELDARKAAIRAKQVEEE